MRLTAIIMLIVVALAPAARAQTTFLNVSYDLMRELYATINAASYSVISPGQRAPLAPPPLLRSAARR